MLRKVVRKILDSKRAKKAFSIYNTLPNNTADTKTDDVVIIRNDGIGDFIMWLGYAQRIKEVWSDRKLTLITNKVIAPLAEKLNLFDRIVIVSNDVDNTVDICRKIYCNLFICPIFSRGEITAIIAKTIKADKKIAMDGDDTNCFSQNKRIFDQEYDILIETLMEYIPEMERYRIFNNKLLLRDDEIQIADLSLFVGDSIFADEYFVINLGGSASFKCWSIESYAKVATYISDKTGWKCVLVGSESEKHLAEEFKSLYKGQIENLVGKTSLDELISLIANSRIIMSNDTSTVHIAAAVDTQCICIAPGFHYPRFTVYPREHISNRENLPIFVMNKMSCYGCMIKIKGRGRRLKCIMAMRNGSMVECISSISEEQVIREFDDWYRR